jgi:hypothetical protein
VRLAPRGDREDGRPRGIPSRPVPADREDLPYKIEIWTETGASVEQIIAATANASIGYAAYYAATREYPDRHITLRQKIILHCARRTVSSPAGAARSTDIT